MQISWRWLVVPSLLIAASGCPDVKVDPDEVGSGGPVVEFDPGNRVIPFPNNLLLDRATGKVNVPASCNEGAASKATREGVVNKLDGFGTFETTMTITFDAEFDMASLMDKVVLYKRAAGGTAVDPGQSTAIPVVLVPSMTARYAADCSGQPEIIPQLVAVAARPLDQKSTYVAAVLAGGKSSDGDDFGPSFTWSLIRQAEAPVTFDAEGNVTSNRTPLDSRSPDDIATLQGLDLLWKAHAQALAFLEQKQHSRSDVLLAWEFNTQTTRDPLDPSIATSIAGSLGNMPLLGINSLTCNKDVNLCPNGIDRAVQPYSQCQAGDSNTFCFLAVSLGGLAGAPVAQLYATGASLCPAVGCAAVGDVIAGAVMAKQFQSETPNAFDAAKPIPGPFADPLAPAMVKTEPVSFIAFVPVVPAPTEGYPTVIFGHGLGSTKKSIFAVGPQLTAARAAGLTTGFLSIAIDFVAHDSRAVRISNTGTGASGCANTDGPAGVGTVPPDPTVKPQCFAPFLSPNLGATRDNIRQSVLDLHSLRNAIAACGTAACSTNFPNFKFNNASVSYLGISLGSIMGSTFVAMRNDIKAATLNVVGHGWVDILENTQTNAIKCSLVDGLIDAGIVTGDKSSAGASAICLTDAWKTQAGYRQFATIGRWILDSADPANFAGALAAKRIFIQKVVGDTVVPNFATDTAAALTGLAASGFAGACAPISGTALPSPELLTMPNTNKFASYTSTTAPAACQNLENTGPGTAGQVYGHASLLRPVPGNCSVTGLTCSSTTQAVGDAQCTAANGGTTATCDITSVARGQLATRRLQTDAATFLITNR